MLYAMTVPAFIKTLNNLTAILDKGAQQADARKVETEVMLNSRLIMDQFSLLKQVQIACDTAKLGVARLAGKEAPVHSDSEKTLGEIKTRIQETIAFLKTCSEKDFAEAATRKITTPRWEGKWMTGEEFALHHAIPNFYFHVTTAYAILRSNGIEVGKKDYLGAMPYKN